MSVFFISMLIKDNQCYKKPVMMINIIKYHQYVLRNVFVIAKGTNIKKGVPIIKILMKSFSHYDLHPISFSTGDGVWLKKPYFRSSHEFLIFFLTILVFNIETIEGQSCSFYDTLSHLRTN